MENKCPNKTARARMNLNLCVLRMFEDTVSLGEAHANYEGDTYSRGIGPFPAVNTTYRKDSNVTEGQSAYEIERNNVKFCGTLFKVVKKTTKWQLLWKIHYYW